jgi:hypothetical protein
MTRHLVSVGVFAVFAFLALGSEKPKEGASSSEPAKAAPKARTPELEVTSAKLFEDYHANEVSGDAKYKGKILAVTGKITGIDKDFMDNIIVKLSTPNQFMNVMAELDSSEAAMAGELSKGQSIRLVCKGRGMVVGSPSLGDCTR